MRCIKYIYIFFNSRIYIIISSSKKRKPFNCRSMCDEKNYGFQDLWAKIIWSNMCLCYNNAKLSHVFEWLLNACLINCKWTRVCHITFLKYDPDEDMSQRRGICALMFYYIDIDSTNGSLILGTWCSDSLFIEHITTITHTQTCFLTLFPFYLNILWSFFLASHRWLLRFKGIHFWKVLWDNMNCKKCYTNN